MENQERIRKYRRIIILRILLIIIFLFFSANTALIFIVAEQSKTHSKPTIEKYIDTTKPKITLSGKNKITLLVGEEYVESGYSAIDDEEDLTEKVVIDSNLNTNIPGKYTIKYLVSDDSGNTTKKTRMVIVEKDYNFETKDPDFYLRTLENYIKKNNYQISLGYYNFAKEYTYRYNAEEEYYGASLVKPVSALYAYENFEPTSYQEQLIKSAISKSNNDAYSSLAKTIGADNLKKYGENLGLTNFMTDKNNIYYSDTSVENQLILWKKIWDFINSNSHGERLKTYLKNDYLNYIEFDNSTETLHKYGFWGENFHDTGIILDESPYIIIILSKEAHNNYPKIFKDISEKLFNFNKLIKKS